MPYISRTTRSLSIDLNHTESLAPDCMLILTARLTLHTTDMVPQRAVLGRQGQPQQTYIHSCAYSPLAPHALLPKISNIFSSSHRRSSFMVAAYHSLKSGGIQVSAQWSVPEPSTRYLDPYGLQRSSGSSGYVSDEVGAGQRHSVFLRQQRPHLRVPPAALGVQIVSSGAWIPRTCAPGKATRRREARSMRYHDENEDANDGAGL